MGLFSSIGNFFGDVLKPVTSVVGGVLGLGETHSNNAAKEDIARQQMQFQQDYAKNRLQWQVEDAKKAGLHPMVAAGLSPSSFSPVSFQTDPLNFDFVKDLGQNLDYASTKAKTAEQQKEAYDFMTRSNENTLRGQELENELKVLEIMSMISRLTQTGPSAPPLGKSGGVIDGQGDSVKIVPDEVTAFGPNPSVTAGTHPLWTHARTGDFSMPVLSGQLADAVTENKEKNVAAEVSYALSAWNGSLRPPMNAFTAKEKKLLKSGEYSAYYYPFMGWRVEPTLSWKNFRKFVLGGFRNRN